LKEEFLHYLWKYNLYDPYSLIDNEKNRITVINPGEYNRDSGPDFFNARLSVSGITWAGNVEIHVKASDFISHGHNLDPAYNNTILHVVVENDRKVYNERGQELLTATISFDPDLYERYVSMVNNPFIIACQESIGQLCPLHFRPWLESLATERLEHKSKHVLGIFSETGNDWEETLYRRLSRYFGFRINAEPFEMLAKALPFKIILKHADNIFQVEALLFGMAGMLDEALFREAVNDAYYNDLAKEYKILAAKYSLRPVHGWLWKFARLRPANFPTLRISQLASMLAVSGGLFSRVLEATGIDELGRLFEVKASGYWDNHYVFGKKSRQLTKCTGPEATGILLINAVIPLIYAHGKYRNSAALTGRALSFLGNMPPESNSIIDEWKRVGVDADSALISQALIQLRNRYCRKRRCLGCRIGSTLLSMGRVLRKYDNLILEP
jgi:hypothetical protein